MKPYPVIVTCLLVISVAINVYLWPKHINLVEANATLKIEKHKSDSTAKSESAKAVYYYDKSEASIRKADSILTNLKPLPIREKINTSNWTVSEYQSYYDRELADDTK